MKKLFPLTILTVLLLTTASTSFAQTQFKEGKGVFITPFSEIGYRFGNHFDLSASVLGYELGSEDFIKVGLTGSYTNYIHKEKGWGYSLDLSLFSLTEPTHRNSILTPAAGASLFKRMKISDTIDILPTARFGVGFPEMTDANYGGGIALPLSIKVFGNKRIIIGPAFQFGRKFDGTSTIGKFGFTLGFNF